MPPVVGVLVAAVAAGGAVAAGVTTFLGFGGMVGAALAFGSSAAGGSVAVPITAAPGRSVRSRARASLRRSRPAVERPRRA